VEATLLVVAAAGAFLFARAESLMMLMVGRALIGLGVSACLMAAFKAFTQWFEPERLPLVNGIQMISGGLGALVATAPVEAALHVTDWRGVFTLLSGVTLLAALAVYLVVPRRDEGKGAISLSEQWQGVRTIYSSGFFWRLAPWAIAAQAAYLSLPGLWAGPWLRDLAGLDRGDAARVLLLLAVAMMAGYFFFGFITERLSRRGVAPLRVVVTGLALFGSVQLALIGAGQVAPALAWILFGFSGTACILPYAVLSQKFPRELAGRANTALNLPVFLGAFSAQWLVGAMIGLWPETATGYHPTGYRAGFGLLLLLQLAAAGWFLWSGRRRHGREAGDA
jgi:predicted MFS family arabinose efflux permease